MLRVTGAERVTSTDLIQELWSGYGKILRVHLSGGNRESVVVKYVEIPSSANHPRGWNSSISHERKLKSYQIEIRWYLDWSSRCEAGCRVPQCLGFESVDDEIFLILEDLDAAGFPERPRSIGWTEIEICLGWLAHFHARFMNTEPAGLWPVGTYWHLETRPDELKALDDLPLREAAAAIDHRLSSAEYRTFVHGDAKLANFCFLKNLDSVAVVDFQYVGGGCGMKDVAYFIGSCLDEASCAEKEAELLDSYFRQLDTALKQIQPDIDRDAVIEEWRELFPVAWTDFHRFLKGWCPGHWKINSYSEQVARAVVEKLNP